MKSQQQPTTIQKTGSSTVSSPMTDEMEIALHPMYPADIMSDATELHIMRLLTVCTGTA